MNTRTLRLAVIAFIPLVLSTSAGIAPAALAQLDKGERKQIAEEAFIYGFPMIMN